MKWVSSLVGLLSMMLTMLMLTGCQKSRLPKLEPPQPNLGAAIVLTLDDSYISNWYQHRDWFDSLGLRITFFISQHRELNSAEWKMLDSLVARGHAVEAHSVHHLNVKDYLKTHDPQDWMRDEIMPQLVSFKAHNIRPTMFAWPYGQVDHDAEALLDKHFLLFRECLNPNRAFHNLADACYAYDGSRTIKALCLDHPHQDTAVIAEAVRFAVERKRALVLYGHELADSAKPGQTPKAGIVYLAKLAASYRLKSVVMGELANRPQPRP